MHEITSETKDSESHEVEQQYFETELLNCVKEVVDNISKNEKDNEESISEKNFLNVMEEEDNLNFQMNETPSDITSLFELATKNTSTEFQPFNPFGGFVSSKEPGHHPVSIASENTDLRLDKINSLDSNKGKKNTRKKARRKKWVIKKGSKKNLNVTGKSSMAQINNCNNFYAKLYESCLNFRQGYNIETSSLPLSSPDGNVLSKNELIMLMTKDLISKINKDEVRLTEEKKELQEYQVTLLKNLISLLKEKSSSVINEDSKIKNNLLTQVENNKKLNFYGFRSSKPPARNKYGEKALEKFFAYSPPPSPTHSIKDEDFDDNHLAAVPISPQSIKDLNFVFKPLFNSFPSASECVLNHSENKNKVHEHRKLANRVNVRPTYSIRKSQIKGLHPKVNEKKIKNRITIKKRKKIRKNNRIKLNALHRSSKNITNNPVKSNRMANFNNSDGAVNSSNINGVSAGPSRGFSKGSFGAPKKLSLMNLRSSLAITSEDSKGNHLDKRTSVKRKLSQMTEEQKQSTSEINSPLKPKSEFTVSFFPNLRKSVNHSPDEIENKKYKHIPIEKVTESKDCTNREANKPPVPNLHLQKFLSNSVSPESTVLYYPVHPFVSHDLPVHFIPIDCGKIPPFLPLYSPLMKAKSNAPIYPSFIRTVPSPDIKTPSDYVLSKGIKSKSIPLRSFSEKKVKENILPCIASTSKCPLIPEVRSKHMSKEVQFSIPKENQLKPVLSETKLKNIPQHPSHSSVNSGSLFQGHIKTNQKVHKCEMCGFVTPKLGVFKRHELSHSQGGLSVNNGVAIDSKIQNNSVQHVQPKQSSTLPIKQFCPVKKNDSLGNKNPKFVLKSEKTNLGEKANKNKKLSANDDSNSSNSSNSFNGFAESFVKETFMKRFPGVTITPLYNALKS